MHWFAVLLFYTHETQSTHMDKPLTFSEWCYESDVENHYERFHGEYGDLAGLLSDYKQYHYNEYLERFKVYGKHTQFFV